MVLHYSVFVIHNSYESFIRTVSDEFRQHQIRITQSFAAPHEQATLQHQQMMQLTDKSESETRAQLCHLSSSVQTQMAAMAVPPSHQPLPIPITTPELPEQLFPPHQCALCTDPHRTFYHTRTGFNKHTVILHGRWYPPRDDCYIVIPSHLPLHQKCFLAYQQKRLECWHMNLLSTLANLFRKIGKPVHLQVWTGFLTYGCD